MHAQRSQSLIKAEVGTGALGSMQAPFIIRVCVEKAEPGGDVSDALPAPSGCFRPPVLARKTVPLVGDDLGGYYEFTGVVTASPQAQASVPSDRDFRTSISLETRFAHLRSELL